MSTYITGFCSTGSCEGTNPKSPSGKSLRTCRGTYAVPVASTYGRHIEIVCTHSCHDTMRELRALAAEMGEISPRPAARAVQETVTPTPRHNPAVVPAAAPVGPLATGTPGLLPFQRAAIEGILRTPSGRAAKGALEEQVRLVLVKSEVFVTMGDAVTPYYISKAIDKDNPPSVGAVGAVLDRWETRGLIVIGRKPVHIQSITSLGERILLKRGL